MAQITSDIQILTGTLLKKGVVISGALCTVEDYVIMSQCAHNKAIYLAAEGTVSVTDISQIQNITIVGRPDFVNNNFKIALYAKETQRYLCFNDHWKLVGMKELQDTCYFNEAIVHGYFVFRSVVDLQRRIGFTQRGRAVGPKKIVNDACYMFTKIPTDQFFHQHTHFSTPKTKSTTTKAPKTKHTPFSTNSARVTGAGNIEGVRTKPNNRIKNRHRQVEPVAPNHSGNGSDGDGSGNGNVIRKLKKQRNGNNKQRQQKHEMQQQMQGHNYNLSNPKNSTYLNSSRQNLVLSQNSFNNNSNTNRKHNNNNSNNNNNSSSSIKNNYKHPPQNHQVRHHHNDPNKVAKRQQHDQKQKTRQRHRLRPTNSPRLVSAAAATSTTATPTTTSKTTFINSTKSSYTLSAGSPFDISPTSVTETFSSISSDNHNTQSATTVVTKRKGRRRKGEQIHKKNSLQKKHMHEVAQDNSKDLFHKSHTHTSSTGPNYEEASDYSSSSTDYAWITNDIMLSSPKPTSASLPSWESWYPSSTTIFNDENSDYFSSDIATSSSPTEIYDSKSFSTSFETSSMTDLENNILTLQTSSVSLPTSVLTTTALTDNSIDETILPSSVTTDLEITSSATATTTTNTSMYTQTDYWSTSLNDNTSLDSDLTDTQATRQFNSNYATPELNDSHIYGLNTEAYIPEDTSANSSFSSQADIKQTTATATVTLPNHYTEGEYSLQTTIRDENETTNRDFRINEAKTTTSNIEIDANNCIYTVDTTDDGNMTTIMATATATKSDCLYATKTSESITNDYNNSKTKKNENFFSKYSPDTKTTTTTATRTKTINLPETSTLQLSQPTLQTQVISKIANKFATEIATTAPTYSSSKQQQTMSTVLTPLTTTRRTLRKSTQRLLATPFHQLTYVRNADGDIDIDSIDNISIYPEMIDNDNIDEPLIKSSTSRLTMISGYLPTSATATLPESIRIAKIKINRERKRIMRLRNIGNYA